MRNIGRPKTKALWRGRYRWALRTLSMLIAVALGMAMPLVVVAQNSGDAPLVVETVEIEGLDRTKPYVVEREFEFEVGATTSHEEIEATLRRLRNLEMVGDVNHELRSLGPELDEPGEPVGGPVELHLEFEERWTLLPITNFRRSGDVTLLRLGAYDTNLLGHYLEFGAAFERLAGVNAGEAWFRNPRLFHRRIDAGVEGAYRNRLYTLYDDGGDIEGGFLLRQFAGVVDADYELLPWLRSGLRLEVADAAPGLDVVSDEIRRAQEERGLPPQTRLVRPGVTVQLGRLDQYGHHMDGAVARVRVDGAHRRLLSTESFVAIENEIIAARTLFRESHVAARFLTGATGAQALHNQFFVGGLDELRGFRDMRFRGAYRWTANLEYRLPSIMTDWVVVQHAIFADAATAGPDPGDLWGLSGSSIGGGIRLLSPKIHGLVLRLDYAYSLNGDGDAPWSFGGEQFF